MANTATGNHVPGGDVDPDGLRPALLAVARAWKVVLPVFLVVLALGGWYVMTTPVNYTSGAVISFVPRQDSINGKDLASLLVERYPEVVGSVDAVNRAAEAANVSPDQVSATLQAAVQPSTLNLSLSVALPSNDQAMAAAESLYLDVLKDNKTDPDLRAVTISAPIGWGPTGTSTKLLLAAVFIVAAVLAIVAGLVWDGLSPSRGSGSTESEE